MKGIWENPAAAAAAEEADKDKKHRRRQNRRPKQSPAFLLGSPLYLRCSEPSFVGSVDAMSGRAENGQAWPARASDVAFISLPTMHTGDVAGATPEISRLRLFPASSAPAEVLAVAAPSNGSMPPNVVNRSYFDPYLPERALEEAMEKGNAFKATFRVNAHNRVEAYCTIDGVPVDILINGVVAQNRAIDGDVVAIMLEPVASWTRLKGLNVASNPVLADDSNASPEVRDVVGNSSAREQVDANGEYHPCTNGLHPLNRVNYHHENGNTSEAFHSDLVNGLGTSGNRFNVHHSTASESSNSGCAFEQGEAARALQRICAMINSYPSKRPTGRVLSVIRKSPRRGAVIGFLAVKQWLYDGEGHGNQINRQLFKRNNSPVALSTKEYIQLIPTDLKFPTMVVSVSTLPGHVKERLNNDDVTVERELVAARIDEWSEESLYPLAHIIHILGQGGEIEPQIAAIMFENAIRSANFSPESLDCLPHVPWEIPVEEFKTRKDLRNICTFTIDPSSAVDLDDALSVEIISDKVFRIGIHIADVSYFVCPDTALDTEAQIRSTSVYILKHKLPMLPPKLSEELGSLKPGVDRLALSIILDINNSGNVIDRWIGRSIIHSCCKLSYDLVQDIIDRSMETDQLSDSGNSWTQLHGQFEWKDVTKSLASLHEISKRLREIRFNNGALQLDNAKLAFLFDECGTPYDSFLDERKKSCSIVEEFMLLANRSVAEVISRVFPDCALLRRHPDPNLRKLKEFEAFCSRHGFDLDTSSSGQFHLSLSKIREKLKNDQVLFDILVSYASRPMQSAAYFCTGDLRGRENDWAHYALSLPFYTHFTSPLRRYPDIIVHRTLSAALDAEEMYMKQNISLGANKGEASGVETAGRCFTGLNFNRDAAESEEGREALSAAALKYKVPRTEVLAEVAAYCNERKLASKHAEVAGEKFYLWALLKKKEVIVSEARVLGLGPRFMSVYINKLAIERRICYDEVEGLRVEWLEATGTLVLDLHRNRHFQRRGCPIKYRAIEDAALLLNPSEIIVAEDDTGGHDAALSSSSLAPLGLAEKSEILPAFFPLVLQHLSSVPVALHAVGGDDGPLDIGTRLYVCSYFR